MVQNQFIRWNETNGQQSWELIQGYLNQGYEIIASGGSGISGYVIMRHPRPQVGPTEIKANLTGEDDDTIPPIWPPSDGM